MTLVSDLCFLLYTIAVFLFIKSDLYFLYQVTCTICQAGFHKAVESVIVIFLFDGTPVFFGGEGRYSVQKTLWGCATNMGSKISLLVYEWSLIKCQIWYVNGSIYKSFPNLSQIGLNLRKFWKKLCDFVQNLFGNWSNWYMNGSLFLEKLVFVWVYF